MIPIRKRNAKKMAKRLNIYRKIPTLFKKQENLRYVFIHKKPDTLRYTIFMKFLKLAFIYIQRARHFALSEVFIYTKSPTIRKKQNKLRYIFNTQKV